MGWFESLFNGGFDGIITGIIPDFGGIDFGHFMPFFDILGLKKVKII